MNFGATNDKAESFSILDAYLEHGGNLIDTANSYSKGNKSGPFHEGGEAEQFIGEWLTSKQRECVVLATKVKADMGDGFSGLSKRSIFHQVENSLRRLNTEYIDLYQAHGPDPDTPLSETLEAFESLKAQGKIRFYGCCNLTDKEIEAADSISKDLKLYGFVSYQNCFNLILKNRLLSSDSPKYILKQKDSERLGIGLICYNALANGFLTGRFRDNLNDLPSSRGNDKVIQKHCFNKKGWRLLEILDSLAKKYNTSPGGILLSFHRKCPFITSTLVGPRTTEQILNLLLTPDLEISDEEFRAIDAASNID